MNAPMNADRLWVLNRGPVTGRPQMVCHVCDAPLDHGDFSFIPPGPTLVVCAECCAIAEFTVSAMDALLDALHGHLKRARRALNN